MLSASHKVHGPACMQLRMQRLAGGGSSAAAHRDAAVPIPGRPISAQGIHPDPTVAPTVPMISHMCCLDRSGSPLDPECDPESHKLSATAPHYLLIDTNVALHQVGVGCVGSDGQHRALVATCHQIDIDTLPYSHPQIDFLEHASISDVVVCSVVLEEVQHKNLSAYQRLRALCANGDKRFYVFANEHHRCVRCLPM